MDDYGWGMFKKGLKRRSKEVRRMRVMTCLAVFFLALTLLLQDNLNAYRMQANYMDFGSWAVRCEGEEFENRSGLVPCGSVLRGSMLYRLYPGPLDIDPETEEPYGESRFDVVPEDRISVSFYSNSRNNSLASLGTFDERFAAEQNIGLYEGRWPQADDEIVMELYALEELGYSYELGQELSFYLAERDDKVFLNAECEQAYLKACEEWRASHPGEEPPEDAGEYFDDDEEDDEQVIIGSDEPDEAPIGDEYPRRDNFTIEKLFGEMQLYKVTFRLVGIMERYSVGWDGIVNGYAEGMDSRSWLPSAVVTRAEFDSLTMDKAEQRFYELSPELKRGRVWETAEELFTNIENSVTDDSVLYVLNRSAYTNPLWGNSGMYRGMTALLIVLSACIIAYLMASYLGKRRPFFMRMREIGASTGEVFSMAAYECVLSVIPAALITFAASYLVGVIAVFIVSKATGVPFRFAFSLRTMLLILACIAGTLALSLAAALLIFAGRGITAKRQGLGRSAARSIKRRSARKERSQRVYLSLSETLVRDRRLHRIKTWSLRIVSILVCGVILLCTFITTYWIKNYKTFSTGYCDVSAGVQGIYVRQCSIPYKPNKWGKSPKIKMNEHGTCMTVDTVLPKAFMDEIESLPGVGELSWYGRDDDKVILDWEGKEEDAFLISLFHAYLEAGNLRRKEYGSLDLENGTQYKTAKEPEMFALYGNSQPETAWKLLEKWLDPAVADLDAFLSGDQVIVMVDDKGIILTDGAGKHYSIPVDEDGVVNTGNNGSSEEETGLQALPDDPWEELGHSFEPGDTITYRYGKEKTLDAVIAGVVPSSQAKEELVKLSGDTRFVNKLVAAICSPAFLEKAVKLIKQDPEDPTGALDELTCYNGVRIRLNEISVNESTLKSISNICAKYNVEYSNWVENKEMMRREMLHNLATYGLFGAMLAVLFFFVISSVQNDENARLAEKISILRRAGTERSSIKKQRMADAFRQTLPLLLSLPVFVLLSAYRQGLFKQFISTDKGDVIIFPNVSTFLVNVIGPQVILPALAVLMLIYWLITSGALRREKE